MKIKKRTKKAIAKALTLALFIGGTLLGVSLLAYEKPMQQFAISNLLISEEVQNYRSVVEKYAAEYEVSGYVDVILAMMMQESGGRGNDPMQSSESYCGDRNCIDDPELSIKQGVYYFSRTLDKAEGDLELAVQSYNFGSGFIDYVHNETGEYTQDVAINFSREMYEKDPEKEKYRCPRKEAKQIDACYGDIYYVRSVMEYRDVLGANK
ncbi:lysozyme family protein [Virgibacillus sp. C22-A2]|uniref:Lysozyme family protein n=1 Tax=Virgibacillus tibetensis TaxID=3042313 RepID=A0ABU6KJ15_9BACI|nr:lysozyme family protein [Virgibacillus sp. C22-A2]